MPDEATKPVTQLLAAVRNGSETARQQLWELVFTELHTIAKQQLVHEPPGTLQPTALVNEAYLRLCGNENIEWTDRRHFFAFAARIMRQIRIDDARRRKRHKRGGDRRPASLHAADSAGRVLADTLAAANEDPAQTLAIDEAISRLERIDPLMAEVVMLRFYVGMTREQIGEVLGIGPRTVDKQWFFARAWLRRALAGE